MLKTTSFITRKVKHDSRYVASKTALIYGPNKTFLHLILQMCTLNFQEKTKNLIFQKIAQKTFLKHDVLDRLLKNK